MLLKILSWPWRRFQRLRQMRPIRFTRFGWFYISFSLAVGASAINTGNNLLYLMLGLLLGFIVISGFLSDSCLWGLDVDVHSTADLYVDQRGEWEITAKKNWFPGIVIWLDATFGGGIETRHLFYWIPRYGSERLRFALTPRERGHLRLTQMRSSTRFPFGLFEKSHTYKMDNQWIVFPKIKPLALNILQAAGINAADEPMARKGPGATPFDIRTYIPGDSSKRIHWKSTAKRGQLMVSEMEEESSASQRLWVPLWPTGADREPFISFVASLLYTLHAQGRPVSLFTPGAIFEPERSRAQLKKILTYLALVEPEKETSLNSSSHRDRIDLLAAWQKVGSHA